MRAMISYGFKKGMRCEGMMTSRNKRRLAAKNRKGFSHVSHSQHVDRKEEVHQRKGSSGED